MIRTTLTTIGLLASLALGACGTLDRPTGPLRIAPDQIVAAQDPRIGANDTTKLQALVAEVAGRISRNEHGQRILALSGGARTGPMAQACWSAGPSTETGRPSTS